MKPHEETWKRKGNDVVTSPRGRVLSVVSLYPNDDASLDLAAAAPEMARALLHGGHWRSGVWHISGCDGYNVPSNCPERCALARAALTKAGALP